MVKYRDWNIEIDKKMDKIYTWKAKGKGGKYLSDPEGGELGTKAYALYRIKKWIDAYDVGNTKELRRAGLKVI